ncbi:hypothetical protein ACSS6W_009219 [Trichoderma asperelloides]
MVIVPVALPHAISDRQIRADPLINPLAILFFHIPKANPHLRDLEGMTSKLHSQASMSIRGGKDRLLHLLIVALRIEIVHHHTHMYILGTLGTTEKETRISIIRFVSTISLSVCMCTYAKLGAL